jgi:hypothetical protein
MQVARFPGEKGAVSNGMIQAFRDMNARKVECGFPFGNLQPLWGRQVPYTMIKFVGFYATQNKIYEKIEKRTGKRKDDFNSASQLAITFACGYWAGIFCAITTQPMDNLVSLKGNEENANKNFAQLAREISAGSFNSYHHDWYSDGFAMVGVRNMEEYLWT